MLGGRIDLGVSAAFIYIGFFIGQLIREQPDILSLTLAVDHTHLELVKLADMSGAVLNEILSHEQIVNAVSDKSEIECRDRIDSSVIHSLINKIKFYVVDRHGIALAAARFTEFVDDSGSLQEILKVAEPVIVVKIDSADNS